MVIIVVGGGGGRGGGTEYFLAFFVASSSLLRITDAIVILSGQSVCEWLLCGRVDIFAESPLLLLLQCVGKERVLGGR